MNTLRTGDIILVEGKSFLSKAISKFTRSAWTHVGFVLQLNGETYIIEQDRTGFRGAGLIMSPLSKYGDNNVLFRRCHWDTEILSKQGSDLLSDLGRFRYGFITLFVSQPIFQVTGIWIGSRGMKNGRSTCSGYVAFKLHEWTGFYPNYFEIDPEDFSTDPNFTTLKIVR